MDLTQQLRVLEAAKGDPARLALTTVDLAHGTLVEAERATIKGALEACAVPHWVDGVILAALLGLSREESAQLLTRLRALSVVEPFPARGDGAVNVHEATRKALRNMLHREQPERFAALSARARGCLAHDYSHHARIERLYHLFAVDPEAAANECETLDCEFTMHARLENQQALAAAIQELLDAGRLEGAAKAEAFLCVAEYRNARGETAQLGDSARNALTLARAAGRLSTLGRAHSLRGDVLMARGLPELALADFQEDLAISRRLASQDLTVPGFQRLAFAHTKVTFILIAQQRRLDAGQATVGDYLASQDPTNAGCQRGLASAHARVGVYFAQQGRLDDARAAFGEYLAISQRLASQDPTNAGWQRDLPLALSQLLGSQDPTKLGWQRDLALAHSTVGDIFDRQGRLDDAQAAFGEYLTISQRLAAQDPTNANCQRDLALAHFKVGDIFDRQGRLDDARAAFGECLTISQHLAAQDPTKLGWQRDLAVAHFKVGIVLAKIGRHNEARTSLREAERQMQRAIAMAPTIAQWAQWPKDLENIRGKLADLR